jgi:hypothetical protein
MPFNFKNIFLSTLLIATCLSSTASHSYEYKISACHGCDTPNTVSEAKKAYDRTESGISYVIDKPNNSFRKFTIYTEWVNTGDHNVPVRRSIEKTLTSAESEAGIELLTAIEELYAGKRYRKGNASSLVADIEIIKDQYGNNAFDFINTSIMRNELYKYHHATNVNRFSTAINGATSKLNLSAIYLKDIKLGFQLIFPDKSSIKVIPNPLTETYDIIPNTARDSSGNNIPLSKDVAGGNYVFTSQSNLENFNNYLGFWGTKVSFKWDNACSSVIVTCRDNGNGRLICTGSCN